ncbi:MAG: ECF transporter S component [Oscillospiraceae bacterium]|jgi:riboflavin transporter FmnP
MSTNVKKLTTMAMLIAISIVLVSLIHFPIFPSATFLEYDPADVPILIGTFLFGPIAGICITAAAAVIQGLTVSAQSGIYGIIMHFIGTGVRVLIAGCIYKRKKTRMNAVIGIVVGIVVGALVMCGANLIITPIFMGAPREAVVAMLLPVILPFNLIKFTLNGAVTFIVYKFISRAFHKWEETPTKEKQRA